MTNAASFKDRAARARSARIPRTRTAAETANAASAPTSRTTFFAKAGANPRNGVASNSAGGWTAAFRDRFRKEHKLRHENTRDFSIFTADGFAPEESDPRPKSQPKNQGKVQPNSVAPVKQGNSRVALRDVGRNGTVAPRAGLKARTADPNLSLGFSHHGSSRSNPQSSGSLQKEESNLPLFTGWVRSYSSYGTNVGIDLFSLLHNSARREFVSLYCILSSMANREAQMTSSDFKAFFAWFAVFEAFLVHSLMAEEEIVVEWAERIIVLPPSLDESERRECRGEIFEIINAIQDLRGLVSRESPAEVISALVEAGDSLAEKCLSWYECLESKLPDAIAAAATVDDKEEVERRVVESFTSGEDPHNSLQLLTRWMEEPELIHSWLNRFVSSKSSRRFFYTYSKKFAANHVGYAENMFAALMKNKVGAHPKK